MIMRKVMLLACAAVAAPLASAPAAFAAAESHQIVYRVFGLEGVRSAGVSYLSPGGEAAERTVSLPWSTSFQAQGDDESLAETLGLYVNRPDSERAAGGLYVCEISVDGQLREKVERDLAEGSMQCFLGDSNNDEVDG